MLVYHMTLILGHHYTYKWDLIVVLDKLRLLYLCQHPMYKILLQIETIDKMSSKSMYLLIVSITVIISNLSYFYSFLFQGYWENYILRR